MSEDKFVVQDSCGDGYELEFAYGIVDLIDKNDNGHIDHFIHRGRSQVTHWMPLPELPEEVAQ